MKPAGSGARSQNGRAANKAIYALALVGVIGVGIGIRKVSLGLPPLVPKIAGDALWAFAVFLCFRLLTPNRSTQQVGLAAALFCVVIEFSQKIHAPWLEALRRTLPGRLTLGSVFAWADFSYYALGMIVALLFDAALRGRTPAAANEFI